MSFLPQGVARSTLSRSATDSRDDLQRWSAIVGECHQSGHYPQSARVPRNERTDTQASGCAPSDIRNADERNRIWCTYAPTDSDCRIRAAVIEGHFPAGMGLDAVQTLGGTPFCVVRQPGCWRPIFLPLTASRRADSMLCSSWKFAPAQCAYSA